MAWTKLGTISDVAGWTFDPRLITTGVVNMVLSATDDPVGDQTYGPETWNTEDKIWSIAVLAGTYGVYVDNPAAVTRFNSEADMWTNYDGIASLTNVTNLQMFINSIIGDLDVVSGLTSLGTLAIHSNSGITGNLSELSALTQLTVLSVKSTNITGDIDALDDLVLMTTFEAEDCAWSQSEVDACLASLAINAVDVGRVATCTVTMGGTNASLSYPDGRADYDTLVTAGWTMTANTWAQLGTISDGAGWTFDPRLIVSTDTNMALTITSTDNPVVPEYSNLFEAGDETWSQAVVAESYFVYVDNPAAVTTFQTSDDMWTNYDGCGSLVNVVVFHMNRGPVVGNLSVVSSLTSAAAVQLIGNAITVDVDAVDDLVLMTDFRIQDNALTQSEVDACLASLVVNEIAGLDGRDCAVTMSGTNAAPSNQGADDAFSLTLDGWTVDITVDAGAFVSIKTQTELQAISTSIETLSWNYRLDSDINMIAAHTAIGDGGNNMMGDFNGNGHKINNMTVVDATHMGLFGVSQGDAYDLGLTNVTIATAGNAPGGVGALVGTTLGAVDRCYSTGSVSSTGATGPDAGGLVGVLGGAPAIVTNSYSWADVVANDAFGGGLVGDGTVGSVITCYSIGAVSGTGTLGGLIGSASTVTNSVYNSETSGQSDNDGRGTPLTTAQMQQIGSYTPAELLTNGDFVVWTDPTVPDGWAKTGTHDANNFVEESPDDTLHIVSDGTAVGTSQVGALVVGVTYNICLTVDTVTANGIFTTDGVANILGATTAPGIYNVEHISQGVTYNIWRSGAADVNISSTSITELPFNFQDTWAMVQWDRRAEGRHNPYGTSRHNPVPYPRLRGVEAFGGRV